MKELFAVVGLSLLLACGGGGGPTGGGGQVQRGINAYNMSAYPTAMQEFGAVDEGRLNGKGRVRLYVYRGLARLRLGDSAGAAQDLGRGQSLYLSGDAKWLPRGTVQEMNDALSALRLPDPAVASSAAPPPTVGTTTSPGSLYLPPQPK